MADAEVITWELSDEDNEQLYYYNSRRASTATEASIYGMDDSSSENETFNSWMEERLQFKLSKTVSKFIENEPRRSRIPRRKNSNTFAGNGRNKPRRVSSHEMQTLYLDDDDDPNVQPESQDVHSEDTSKRMELRRRKRSANRLRASERDFKRETGDGGGDGCKSLIVNPILQSRVKVDTPNRFLSLNSKPVPCREAELASGSGTPKKFLPSECPTDRIEFYKVFSLLIKMGNPERQRKERNFARQPSKEDQVWQNKLNDLLWLELQAWHAGRSLHEQDEVLCLERSSLVKVLDEVMNFSFCSKESSEDIHSCLPENARKISAFGSEGLDTLIERCDDENPHDAPSIDPESTLPHDGQLSLPCSMFCPKCIHIQNLAILQVADLLNRVESLERLYPSSRAMKKQLELYEDEEFVDRIKTLCQWLNITSDLRQKISCFGRVLFSFAGKDLQWPCFRMEPNPSTESRTVTVPNTDDGVPVTQSADVLCRQRKTSKTVRFQGLMNGSDGSSGYGSNEGTSSGSEVSTPIPPTSLAVAPEFPNAGISTYYFRTYSESSSECGSTVSPYRRYVDKLLKQKGLRKILQRLSDVTHGTLIKAKLALQRQIQPAMVYSPDPVLHEELPTLDANAARVDAATSPKMHLLPEGAEELEHYGIWSAHFQKLKLPSFRGLYLFLLRVPLDVVHECLQLRLEQQPDEPSSLSIRQLMRECKEVIKAAVIIRQTYNRMSRAVLLPNEFEAIEMELEEFDNNVKRMLEVYLKYLHSWTQMLQKLPQVCLLQKNFLEEEWSFIKIFCRFLREGEAMAGNNFCLMASEMLSSTGYFLEAGIDDCTSFLYDSTILDNDANFSLSTRYCILKSCRAFQDVFQQARERAMKAVAFAKTLRKDFEIGAEFVVHVTSSELLEQLNHTGHVRVIAPHCCYYMLFVPGYIKDNHAYLLQLLDMACAHEPSTYPECGYIGYLLILRYNEGCLKDNAGWKGSTVIVEPTAEVTITLSHIEIDGLLLVVNHSAQLGQQCREFHSIMLGTVSIAKEFTPCNHAIAESLSEMKEEALALRDKITQAVSHVEEKLDMDSITDLDETDKSSLQARCREVLHQCYRFGFEYHKEVTRLVTGEARGKLGIGIIAFAHQWMNFVSQRCERGRGVRPRWANNGLEFLMAACDPQYLKQLSEEEFSSLKKSMNECITHLIGSVESKSVPQSGSSSRSQSPTMLSRPNFRHSSSWYEPPRSPRGGVTVATTSKSDPNTPSSASVLSANLLSVWGSDEAGLRRSKESLNDISEKKKLWEEVENGDTIQNMTEGNRRDKIADALLKLEESRESKLLEGNMIGRVTEVHRDMNRVHINARRVTFHWQRGIKIGQGRFGKVYTAVNNDSGDLMALKEIHLQPNDHKTIREIADELRIFEGIRHERLVRYFGVEIHKEEMFIFMEYCDCGTLESAAQLGLPEPQIRKYTRQLLEAVLKLHDNGIVHRDIKGANIFLTSDGNLKLGDFGCCIKLKNHTTMAGELNAFVGTQAYMAPEVFTKNRSEGHGRAADIWSVACVVVEMSTGKRPWFELENHYQIMFKVGMGEVPETPDTLSEEGKDFLSRCFKNEPRERWTASQLLDHPFTKVDSDDEFQSLPFFN